jgi:hypothetical protein
VDADSSGRFDVPKNPIPPPIPAIRTRAHVRINFDEDTSKWVMVNSGTKTTHQTCVNVSLDSQNYDFCFEIWMNCVGTDDNRENSASFFLRQHVEKQKEVIWNILTLRLFCFYL